MPQLSFNIRTYIENAGFLPELQARTLDLSPAFEEIFKQWTDINAQKFEQSVGKEASGAEVFDEFWSALTPEYMAEKHGDGSTKVTKKMKRGKARFEGSFPDWLMVRTGALREAMTNPEALFSDIEPQQAIFGTPNDPDLADIVRWQAGAKQKERYVVFLSEPDRNMIKQILQDYLSMGGKFMEMRSAKGLAAVSKEAEIEQMDAEFNYDADVEGE